MFYVKICTTYKYYAIKEYLKYGIEVIVYI